MAVVKQKSAGVSHQRINAPRSHGKNDARVMRTRERIDAAFVQLLHRRSYGDIRVSDITKKAGVGRATFYAHYSDKDELLRSQFERIVAPLLTTSTDDPTKVDAFPFFAHICSAPQIYKALMGLNAGTAPGILRDCFEIRAREVLSLQPSPQPVLQTAVVCRFIASSLLAITECWLERGGRETPQQVQTLFARLVSPGLRACRDAGLPTSSH